MLRFVMSSKGTPSCEVVAGGPSEQVLLGRLELVKVEWDEEQQDYYVTLDFDLPADLMVHQLPPGTVEALYIAAKPFMYMHLDQAAAKRVLEARDDVLEASDE